MVALQVLLAHGLLVGEDHDEDLILGSRTSVTQYRVALISAVSSLKAAADGLIQSS